MSRWTIRRAAALATTTVLAAGLGVVSLAPASAWAGTGPTPTPTPSSSPTSTPKVTTSVDGDQVTITTDLATARAACAKVDAAQDRLTRLVARIEGDQDTAGSVAYLQARAQRAAGEGHDDLANTLQARATRRGGWLDDLQRALDRLARADHAVCDALPEAGR